MIEIWLFEHDFQTRNFGQLQIFGGIKFVNKLFMKVLNFIRISNYNRNGKVEIATFRQKLVQSLISEEPSANKNKLNTAFNHGI